MYEYKIVIECQNSWAEDFWTWKVYSAYGNVAFAEGNTATHWGAMRQGKRAVKRLRKGHAAERRPLFRTHENHEEYLL